MQIDSENITCSCSSRSSSSPTQGPSLLPRSRLSTWTGARGDWVEQQGNSFYRTHSPEVKWALGSICMNKASGTDGIPAELFWILKNDALKVLYSLCQQIWKAQQWPQDWKRAFFIPIPKKGNAKECSNYCTIALISHTSKVMLKCSKPGFSNMWTMNFQMFKLVLEKAEEPETNCQHPLGHWKSRRVPEKHLCLLYWLHQIIWLCGSQQTVENS